MMFGSIGPLEFKRDCNVVPRSSRFGPRKRDTLSLDQVKVRVRPRGILPLRKRGKIWFWDEHDLGFGLSVLLGFLRNRVEDLVKACIVIFLVRPVATWISWINFPLSIYDVSESVKGIEDLLEVDIFVQRWQNGLREI